jgi:hypothetical protein
MDARGDATSLGFAIFLVAIIGLAVYSRGFRVLLLWLTAAVVVIAIALFAYQANVGHQEQQKARIEADKRRQQLEAGRREIEQVAPQVCPDLSTQKQCMEETEAACRSYWDLGERKGCMLTAASWCPNQGARKQCIADILRTQQATKEEQARQAQQAQHDAWCAKVEQQIPDAVARWRLRGNSYFWQVFPWEGYLPAESIPYIRSHECPNVEKAIDGMLAAEQQAKERQIRELQDRIRSGHYYDQ